jgi:hypothetical protein
LALPADPVLIEGHWVDIDLARRGRAQYSACRQMVLDELEPERLEGAQHLVDAVEFDDDVDVFVFSGLFAEERIHAPPAIEPNAQPGSFERIKDFEDLIGQHAEVLSLLASSPSQLDWQS